MGEVLRAATRATSESFMGVVLGSQNTCMNALISTDSKSIFAFLAVQKANCALGQDCTDNGHGARINGYVLLLGVFWGSHVGSYRCQVCFSQDEPFDC